VFKDIDHTAANASAAAPGLYAGAMAVPVLLNPAPANTGADLLTKAYVWIAANARASGKYRIVLGDNANQAAKELNAAAFHSVANVIITLAGDTEERTIQLTGIGQLYTITGAGTLRLDNFITLKGVEANTGGVLVKLNGANTKLIMETGSKITRNWNSSTSEGTTGGGGVLLMNGAVFTMNGGIISENKFLNGNSAGVYLRDGTTTFNMTGGEITGNQGKWAGGVIVINSGTFNMSGGSIHHNSAISWGAGVGVNATAATFNMSGSAEIYSNTSSGTGGGVYVGNGNFNMSDSAVIKGNMATSNGGGVWINADNGRIAKTGGTIYGNEADTALKNTATANGGAAVYVNGTYKRETTVTETLAKTGASAYTGDWTD
jgi:hypothetical protein